jgi:hypothetical protein
VGHGFWRSTWLGSFTFCWVHQCRNVTATTLTDFFENRIVVGRCRRIPTMQQATGTAPFPDARNIARLVTSHFAAVPPEVPVASKRGAGSLYNIRARFGRFCHCWIDHLQFDRFERDSSVLYRHTVTDDLFRSVEAALDEGPGMGIFVKGPHGIGKSHTFGQPSPQTAVDQQIPCDVYSKLRRMDFG